MRQDRVTFVAVGLAGMAGCAELAGGLAIWGGGGLGDVLFAAFIAGAYVGVPVGTLLALRTLDRTLPFAWIAAIAVLTAWIRGFDPVWSLLRHSAHAALYRTLRPDAVTANLLVFGIASSLLLLGFLETRPARRI